MARLRKVTADEFDTQVLDSPIPVVVDFYADWCAPCRVLTPLLERYAAALAGRIDFVKVNVDEEPELAEQFGISGIPTLLFTRDGELADSLSGLPSQAEFQDKLQRLSQPPLAN